MSTKKELQQAQTWNKRLVVILAIVIVGSLTLHKQNQAKLMDREKDFYKVTIKTSELLMGYIDQKRSYIELLVVNGIIDPIELEAVDREKARAQAEQQERIQKLRAKYHLPASMGR